MRSSDFRNKYKEMGIKLDAIDGDEENEKVCIASDHTTRHTKSASSLTGRNWWVRGRRNRSRKKC